ncbi:MAG: RCC1 domain-containing protein, partial [Candidatus Acidiferrales bacterium]
MINPRYIRNCVRIAGIVFSTGFAYAQQAPTKILTQPVDVPFAPVTAIASGADFNFAIRADGKWLSWGNDNNGQLGDGGVNIQPVPVVNSLNNYTSCTAVSIGATHGVAILTPPGTSSSNVLTWGGNGYGQLGNWTTNNSATPRSVTDGFAVAAGAYHTAAIRMDGTVSCWGLNSSGQLGDGTTTNELAPVQAIGITNAAAIAAGYAHTLVLKADGTVWAWGSNSNGQLGDGSTTNRLSPIQVPGLSGVISIAAGGYHNIVLKSDGTLWVWGSNAAGQLGDGTTTQRNSPIQL